MTLLWVAAGSLAACGGNGYGDQNAEVVEPLIARDDVLEVTDSREESYCRDDSCLFDDNGTVTVFDISINVDDDALLDALGQALPGWTINQIPCGGADSDCENDNVVSLVRNNESIRIAYSDEGDGSIRVDVGG
jgi:hypothetical protein